MDSNRFTTMALSLCGTFSLACARDGAGPSDPRSLQLSASVHLDSAAFSSDGRFTLELVPYDASGTRYLNEAWQIQVTLGSRDSAFSLGVGSPMLVPADTLPHADAILIDDSGSLLGSDPDRKRADAAQLFWESVLAARAGNVVALLDFGRGDVPPTPGFAQTNLLQDFTSDAALLDARLDSIQARSGAGTRLYRSGTEVARWIDSTVPAGSYIRNLVILTDGKPNDSEFREDLFTAVDQATVRIFAVGLGEAADPAEEAAVVVEELAKRTGGVYAAASSPGDLTGILSVLASTISDSRLLVEVQLTPVPRAGVPIAGTVALSGARGTATAPWSFIAP